MPLRSLAVAVLLALAAACAGRSAPHPVPRRAQPPKPVDFSKPPPGDNSRCYVCHLNLEEEPLVRAHAYGDVTCEDCHGPSDDHCGAENHDIAPTVIFAKDKIPAACWKCHEDVKPDAHFKPANAADAKKGCLECHFKHRLDRRDREWDKATRRLLR